jgi:hypothetical protein
MKLITEDSRFNEMIRNLLIALTLILIQSCNTDYRYATEPGKIPVQNTENTPAPAPAAPTRPDVNSINLYVENSGSMNGYVSGNTRFKQMVGDLIVNLRHTYNEDSINVFFINEIVRKTDPAAYGLTKFAQSLDQGKAPYRISNIDRPASTYFDEILEKVVRNTGPNSISVLVSDCIYSPRDDKGQVIGFARSRITDLYWGALQANNDLSTAIFKLESEFNGTYYSEKQRGNTITLQNFDRPYYIWVIAGQGMIMTDLLKNVEGDIRNFAGFRQKHVFSGIESATPPYWSLLTMTRTGFFIKPDVKYLSGTFIRGVEGFQPASPASEFPDFTIVADMSHTGLEDSYITDPANYDIVAGDYTLRDAGLVNHRDQKINFSEMSVPVAASDWNRIKSSTATHALYVTANSRVPGNLTISLRKKIPEWVQSTHTENDVTINDLSGTTYNFKYLVEGIASAYSRVASTDSYMNLTLSVRPPSKSNFGGFIIAAIIIALVAAGIFIVIRNRTNA